MHNEHMRVHMYRMHIANALRRGLALYYNYHCAYSDPESGSKVSGEANAHARIVYPAPLLRWSLEMDSCSLGSRPPPRSVRTLG